MKPKEQASINRRARSRRTSRSVKLRETNRPFVEKKLLGHDIKLSIHTVGMRFLIPHDTLWQWVETETNVPNTYSWIEIGLYSWPKTSVKMLNFLNDFEVKDCPHSLRRPKHLVIGVTRQFTRLEKAGTQGCFIRQCAVGNEV
jgi:hypothetical protein